MTSRAGRPGSPGQEMFMDRPSKPSDSPTIEPLRIQKRDASPDPYAISASSSQQQRVFVPPAGALGSAAPLPYPDDRLPAASNSSRLPYPDSDNYPSGRGATTLPPAAGARSNVPDYPPALRPRDGRTQSPPPANLTERRGTGPKPLPDSPGPETPEKEGLFQRQPKRGETPASNPSGSGSRPQPQSQNSYEYKQKYFEPPGALRPPASGLNIPNPSSVNRLGSTASNATTRAQRGSPPPPETPISGPAGGANDIESRFAASGIPGQGTLDRMQAQSAQSAAAQQRQNQYGSPPPGQQTQLHQAVYQGPGQSVSPAAGVQYPKPTSPDSANGRAPPTSALENDMARMQISNDPPPAYSSVSGTNQPSGATTATGFPMEKTPLNTNVGGGTPVSGPVTAASAATGTSSNAENYNHPAYANDPHHAQVQQHVSPQPSTGNQLGAQQHPQPTPSPQPSQPTTPPPLPEGWIAHIDPKSGQYYYIHVKSQSTQWEFPTGPTPLNLDAPLSPAVSSFAHPLQSPGLSSTFGQKPLQSPGFTPSGYAESVISTAPTVSGFTGPPPSSGVDVFKVAPTNGVYFGPYLRYINMDMERGQWLGSILLVTDASQPPTIHCHQSEDLRPNPRQLKAVPISRHQRYSFYRYDLDLHMEEHGSAKWTYAITSHLGCTRYEFLVAGRYETSWRFVATSGNDFSLNVSANERNRLGGVGFMWKDIMSKHVECGGFHTQLGLGDQIYADRIWREVPLLKQWLTISGKENRKNEAWTAAHEEAVNHAYFHYYTSHFDQPFLREAFAQIPSVLSLNDHDIFDGFGSYPEYMQFSNMFKNIGRIGIDTYLLFQHHTTLDILRNVSSDTDIFTITGTGWHFVKYLGPAVVLVGPDTRSERNPHQVMAGATYQGLFPKIATLPPSAQHCIWMLSTPVIYPRLDFAEQLGSTMQTGKKAVTDAYNMLGKVAGGVAGVVGAKNVVGSGFDSVKKAVGKSGLMGGILSPFGEIDVLDEVKDMWTHESKDLERTYLIRTLQGISNQKALRMTFLSGSVSCAGAGLVHDPAHPSDHKTMYQLISSSVVNTPPASYILKMLQSSSKPLYVPQNGQRTTNAPSDTKEDMMEIFQTEPDGRPREGKKLMGRRNYVAIVAYDPEVVAGTYGRTDMGHGGGKLSLAADFMVQNEQSGGVVKYGPVIVPSLEYGR